MIDAQALLADLQTHHIEGIAREGNTPFTCPLITPLNDNLWQGGCIQGVDLQGYFKHIISLYPWERFNPGGDLDSFTEVRLYDGPRVPDEAQLYALARWINLCKGHGRTLVHCQAGLNRSGLLTGLSLVLDGVEPRDAIAYTCGRNGLPRSCVTKPLNSGYWSIHHDRIQCLFCRVLGCLYRRLPDGMLLGGETA